MGGLGSGWQREKRATVEDSVELVASELVDGKAIVTGKWSVGAYSWTHRGADAPHMTIGYEANLADRGNAWLRLFYLRSGEPVDYKLKLVATTPHYGGLRWWFICPLVRTDNGPPRRVAKLYLPPGGKYFGSREGYGLTYTSCQESGKNRGFLRLLERAAA